MRTPFVVDDTEFLVTASIGLAFAPRGCEDATAEMLVRDADTAMYRAADTAIYRAKEAGRDAVAVFDDSMRAQLAERLEIERDLRHAIARGQLHLAFQPIVGTRTGCIVGVEALVRWLHPTLGVVVPTRFIPLAEESNPIVEIGSWVLDEAQREIAHCRSLPGLENLRVSVHLSAVQLRDEMLVEHVGRALATNGLPGSALCLELTETVVMGDPEAALAAFAALRRLDVRLAIDDFGTEHSSLAYLQRLPVDTLKIDRSFVDGLREPDSAADTLAAAIVAIARALGMETIADGVESADQAKRVAALGCDAIPGDVQRGGYPGSSQQHGPRVSPGRFDVVEALEARPGIYRKDDSHDADRQPSPVVHDAEEDARLLVGTVLLFEQLRRVAEGLEEDRPLDVPTDLRSVFVRREEVRAHRLVDRRVDGVVDEPAKADRVEVGGRRRPGVDGRGRPTWAHLGGSARCSTSTGAAGESSPGGIGRRYIRCRHL
ncbi:MAG: putative bifunctional diguanylate cyclase/phosphodiesterase [Acidimicrobiales bacterium]